MSSTLPRYTRSRPGFGGYKTHLLLGYVITLSLLVLLLHIPWSASSSMQWTLRSSKNGVLVYETQEKSSDEDGASSDDAGTAPERSDDLPPQTQQTVSSTSPTDGAGQGDSTSATGSDQNQSEVPPDVRTVTSMTNVREPEIMGGRGAYYLQIRYPEAARREGIEGQLRLRFVVTKEGSPRYIRVTKPAHPLLDSAAVQALRSVKFRPAVHRGDAVPVWMTMPVRFRLLPDSSRSRTADTHSSR